MHRHRLPGLLPVVLVLLIVPDLVSAATLRVRKDGSGDYLTIGGAVAAASPHDVIEVGPGTYKEQVDVLVPLAFVSTAGAAATIVDGEALRYTMWFRGGVGSSADGFTFAHGQNFSGGGAIRAQAGATATLKNCIIENNHSDYDGGALFTRDSGSFLDVYDCVIRYNRAEHNGSAGIAILGSRINYTRCTFYGHTCGLQNAGTSCDHSSMDIKQCLYYGNSSDSFSPIYYYESVGSVDQSTIYGNYGGTWGGVTIHSSTVNVTHSIIGGNTGGYGLVFLGGSGTHTCNLYFNNNLGDVGFDAMQPSESVGNPLFCDAASADYHVGPSSPAAPSHNSCGVLLGALGVSCNPVAVAISSFEVSAADGAVSLRGTFSSTLNVQSVAVYRAEGDAGLIRIATVPVVSQARFEYQDRTVIAGRSYRYQIGVTDGDGEFMSPIKTVSVAPFSSGLDQNHPNPFNPQTTIHYTVAAPSRVTVVVYDATGRLVRTLVNEEQTAGARDVAWNGIDDRGQAVASGVYFCKLSAGKFTQTRRMVMLK
jgi:hypothetical protein